MEFPPLVRLLPYLRHKYLSSAVFALLLLWISYQMATLTWMIVPVPQQSAQEWVPEKVVLDKKPIGMGELLKAHLFGEAEKKVSKPVKPRPDGAVKATPLNVTLTGIVASSEEGGGIAIIENRGKQGTYGVGDMIEGTQAEVTEVLSDRVLLDNRGRSEFLMLDGESATTSSNRARPSFRDRPDESRDEADGHGNADGASLKDKMDELRDNPGKLTDYLTISPVREDGEIKGYRLNPGKEKLFFTEFDLKPNDLAVAFNGFDLTDSAQAMSVMKELADLTEASITVERDGQLHDIFIQLP